MTNIMTNEKAATFKNLLQTRPYITGVGALDALEAKMIERAGFNFILEKIGLLISAVEI